MSALLPIRMVEKPWGRKNLPAPFGTANSDAAIGEIWFEPPAAFDDLLVKYLFTSERLSVQVHPPTVHGAPGKTECWLIIDTEPGAEVALGFREPISCEAMRSAALDGSIEQLLEWHPVRPGDFFFVPPGTVHAIGAGVSLIEVQENHDITYRLFDYGRPRELHLDDGLRVAHGSAYPAANRKSVAEQGTMPLLDAPPFRVTRFEGEAGLSDWQGAMLVVSLDEGVTVNQQTVEPGQCGYAPSPSCIAAPSGARWIGAQPTA